MYQIIMFLTHISQLECALIPSSVPEWKKFDFFETNMLRIFANIGVCHKNMYRNYLSLECDTGIVLIFFCL